MWLNQPSESLQKEKDSQKLMPRACRGVPVKKTPWQIHLCPNSTTSKESLFNRRTRTRIKIFAQSFHFRMWAIKQSLFRLPRVPIRSLLYLLYWSWVPISKLAGFRNRGMWGPGDLKGPFLSIVTPIEEKNANYSQITYACQDFWFIKSFIQFLLAK